MSVAGSRPFGRPSPKGITWPNNWVLRCHRERRSYVYLNIEFDDGTPGLPLRTALAQREAERTIVVFRNEPPIVGSELIVVPPPGITLPR